MTKTTSLLVVCILGTPALMAPAPVKAFSVGAFCEEPRSQDRSHRNRFSARPTSRLDEFIGSARKGSTSRIEQPRDSAMRHSVSRNRPNDQKPYHHRPKSVGAGYRIRPSAPQRPSRPTRAERRMQALAARIDHRARLEQRRIEAADRRMARTLRFRQMPAFPHPLPRYPVWLKGGYVAAEVDTTGEFPANPMIP